MTSKCENGYMITANSIWDKKYHVSFYAYVYYLLNENDNSKLFHYENSIDGKINSNVSILE